jgi:hypothetical protein
MTRSMIPLSDQEAPMPVLAKVLIVLAVAGVWWDPRRMLRLRQDRDMLRYVTGARSWWARRWSYRRRQVRDLPGIHAWMQPAIFTAALRGGV